MFKKPARFVGLILLLIASGCGKWPPSVETRDDIRRLPASEPSICARGLADQDIPALARFRNLRFLDFSGGNAVKEAKITDAGLAELAKLDLPHLETLQLGWCNNITDAGLIHVGQMQTITGLGLVVRPSSFEG